MDGNVVMTVQDLLFFGFLVFFGIVLLVVFSTVALFFMINGVNWKRPWVEKGAYQAADVPNDPLAGAFTESGDFAYQAGAGFEADGVPTQMKEAMKAMDDLQKQIDRATTQVLRDKIHPSRPVNLVDPALWSGPHQASAPGVKDE